MLTEIKKHKPLLEQLKEYMLIALVVLLFNNFIISCNRVPSSSMVSTINEKDRILVSMLPYYYRNPLRGEIVVFYHDDEFWVKRVVGLPGDIIGIFDGNVYINGQLLDESQYLDKEGTSTPNPFYEPLDFPYKVPKDSYFLMGDNRPGSYDGRYIGAVAAKDITGKALLRFYPFNKMGFLS